MQYYLLLTAGVVDLTVHSSPDTIPYVNVNTIYLTSLCLSKFILIQLTKCLPMANTSKYK